MNARGMVVGTLRVPSLAQGLRAAYCFEARWEQLGRGLRYTGYAYYPTGDTLSQGTKIIRVRVLKYFPFPREQRSLFPTEVRNS